jgi:hypothetical protein
MHEVVGLFQEFALYNDDWAVPFLRQNNDDTKPNNIIIMIYLLISHFYIKETHVLQTTYLNTLSSLQLLKDIHFCTAHTQNHFFC